MARRRELKVAWEQKREWPDPTLWSCRGGKRDDMVIVTAPKRRGQLIKSDTQQCLLNPIGLFGAFNRERENRFREGATCPRRETPRALPIGQEMSRARKKRPCLLFERESHSENGTQQQLLIDRNRGRTISHRILSSSTGEAYLVREERGHSFLRSRYAFPGLFMFFVLSPPSPIARDPHFPICCFAALAIKRFIIHLFTREENV